MILLYNIVQTTFTGGYTRKLFSSCFKRFASVQRFEIKYIGMLLFLSGITCLVCTELLNSHRQKQTPFFTFSPDSSVSFQENVCIPEQIISSASSVIMRPRISKISTFVLPFPVNQQDIFTTELKGLGEVWSMLNGSNGVVVSPIPT